MDKSTGEKTIQSEMLIEAVLNLDLTFHWIGHSDRMWYRRQTPSGKEYVVVDAESGQQNLVSDEIATRNPPLRSDWVISPDGRKAVLRIEHNLWLRDLTTNRAIPITSDGELDFGYGDIDPSYDRQSVARRRSNVPPSLIGVIWSPSSRFILALRQDLRPFSEKLFVAEYAAADRSYAYTHFRRMPLARDEQSPNSYLGIFDTETSMLCGANIDPQAFNDLSLHYFLSGIVWWNEERRTLFMVNANRGGSRYALICMDLATGGCREILHEESLPHVRLNPSDYSRPNVFVTSSGKEVIWYSEKTGHGHLYLHDAITGAEIRPLTHRDWVVFDLLHVDERHRLAYFTAATLNKDDNPYYRYLYRVSFDGGAPQLLTPEVADHKFNNPFFRGSFRFVGDGADSPQPGSRISPTGRYFVDSYSTVDQAPEYVLRRSSGELVCKLLSADASLLHHVGWRPPERFVAKAADGFTDLYGVITYPRNFDKSQSYPVIDSMYPGPQGSFAPRSFADQLSGGSIHHVQDFADAGFIIITLDARGTAHRSHSFRNAFLGTEDVFGAADHVAAIRYLAATRPHMDCDRVGVRGQSFGGYGGLRAMLLYPDFFKVGVCATGPGEWLDMQGQLSIERFFGVAASSTKSRNYYEVLSNTRIVSRLKGPVLLIYGGIDENVPLKHAFVLIDALIKADKDVDMLLFPNETHAVARHPYAIRRSIQFFLDNLA